jgi:CBS domain-containing protein
MKSRVQDVMTTSVVSVVESAPFKQIVRLMETHGVSALPVVDADGKVVGVVSEGDMILKEAYEPTADGERHLFEGRRRRVERSKAAGLVAADLMTAPAVTVKGTATLTVAARLIGERNIKRLPVVDEAGRIAGIVSRVDLLRVFLRPDEEIRDEVQHDVMERTLWMDLAKIRITVDGVVTLQGIVEQRSLIPIVVGLVHGVDGVVGVNDRLSYEVDDVSVRPDMIGPWGLIPYGATRN